MPFQPFAPDWDRAGWSGNEQWKWLAVEIAEIRRCAAVGDQAHDRLALLLIPRDGMMSPDPPARGARPAVKPNDSGRGSWIRWSTPMSWSASRRVWAEVGHGRVEVFVLQSSAPRVSRG